MRRVVRLSSCTPRRCSICARRLLTAGVLMSSSRPAAEKLPARSSWLKNAISEGAEADLAMAEGPARGKVIVNL